MGHYMKRTGHDRSRINHQIFMTLQGFLVQQARKHEPHEPHEHQTHTSNVLVHGVWCKGKSTRKAAKAPIDFRARKRIKYDLYVGYKY